MPYSPVNDQTSPEDEKPFEDEDVCEYCDYTDCRCDAEYEDRRERDWDD